MCGDAVLTMSVTECIVSISVCVILHMSVITQNGYSALMRAAMEGNIEVVVELVKAGANVDMKDDVCQYIYTYITHDVYITVQNHTSFSSCPESAFIVTHILYVYM